ncbi:MAG: Maf family protein [Veillonellales bacterium]
MTIILASASPRRRELLEQVGCEFSIITSDVEEDNTRQMMPAKLAVSHAQAKALAVASTLSRQSVVIGADTIVVFGGKVYGKPADGADARRMLLNLAGKDHQVITGIAVVKGENLWTDFAVTAVRLADLTAKQIEAYVNTGEPMDKAGAYAIQGKGALFVESIQGSYSNVVGLPLKTLADLLKKAGVSLL